MSTLRQQLDNQAGQAHLAPRAGRRDEHAAATIQRLRQELAATRSERDELRFLLDQLDPDGDLRYRMNNDLLTDGGIAWHADLVGQGRGAA